MADPRDESDAFVPKGAIAFFVAMLVFYIAFWFGLYALLVQRG
jgi:Cytochrome c oxidase subunit IIa family